MDESALLALLNVYPDFEKGSVAGTQPFRLERTRRLLEVLAQPDSHYRIVHIAGTKGKGSTASTLSCILMATGLRVGLYTSPHLLQFSERICVNAYPVPLDELMRTMNERILPALAELESDLGSPTFFEVTTALALEVFARSEVDVAVIEVGLGGWLDATNAIQRSEVVVLTPISLDHTNILGRTVEEIAQDKAGIIKPGSKVVVAPQPSVAFRVIEERCRRLGCSLESVNPSASLRRSTSTIEGQHLYIDTASGTTEAWLSLPGRHQAENAATAIAAARALVGEEIASPSTLVSSLSSVDSESSGSPLEPSPAHNMPRSLASGREAPGYSGGRKSVVDEALQRGLERTRVRGRFELLGKSPAVIVDVAHNQAAALALSSTVAEALGDRVTYVIGMSSDKDHEAFARAIESTASSIVCVQAQHPRSTPAVELAWAFSRAIAVPIEVGGSSIEGLAVAQEKAGPEGSIVVTGSFYVVAEATRELSQAIPAAT